MASQILHAIAKEPPLLPWLHAHNPDRNLTHQLLEASITHIMGIPSAETLSISKTSFPPTPSLFVPMYRRNQFILGQLCGPMSPNVMSLDVLAKAGYGTPLNPISRRFVVDLSSPFLNFVEYEWFSDGKVCVSTHAISAIDGLYSGESILLDSPNPNTVALPLQRNDLLLHHRQPYPTKVIMRVNFSEHISCQICIAKGTNCNCPPTMEKRQPVRPFAQPTNWKSWASAMIYSRSSSASKITLHFSKLTSKGTISGSKVIYFSQSGEIGVGPSSPTGNRLIKMFMQKSNMMLSHPTTDDPVRYVDDNHRRVEQPLQLTDSSSRSPFVLLQDMSGHHDSSYKQSQNHLQYQSASEIPSQSAANAPQYSDSDFLVENCPPHRSYKSSISAALLSDDNRSTVLTTPPLPPYVSSESTPSSSLEPCVTNYCSLQQESVTRSACLPGPVKPSPPIAKPTVKKVAKPRDKAITCECGLTFNHRGHYNEHRKCVHDKIKQHKCAFVNCQSEFFKKSDRDRHMRSKHDSAAVVCTECDITLSNKLEYDMHMEISHERRRSRSLTCQTCGGRYPTKVALTDHINRCHSLKE